MGWVRLLSFQATSDFCRVSAGPFANAAALCLAWLVPGVCLHFRFELVVLVKGSGEKLQQDDMLHRQETWVPSLISLYDSKYQ